MKREIIFDMILFLCIGSSSNIAAYVANGDGTVTDSEKGLMWQQATPNDTYLWKEALDYCNGLTLAGHSDWRLPNLNELQSLVDYGGYDPVIDETYFPGTVSYYYWCSSSCALGQTPLLAWYVRFDFGGVSYGEKGSLFQARAVRGGQSRLFGHLIISKPRQASKWNIDAPMPIIWGTAGISGNVAIFLSRLGGRPGSYEKIAASTPNDGTFEWTVNGASTVNAALKIEPLSDPSKGTVQSLFSIVNNISIDPLGLAVAEPSGEATFTIKLKKAPTADVIIDLFTTNPGEFTLVDGGNNRTNKLTVTLGETDWETGIDVTVRAEADNVPDGDQVSQVLTSMVKSDDPDYSGLNIANVSVTVKDEQAGVYFDSVYPAYGSSTEDFSTTIQGIGFVDGTTQVFTISSDGVETEISPVTVDNAETLHVTIPAPGAPVDYDLKVANSDNETDILKSAVSFADATKIAAQRAKKAVIVAGGGPFLDNDLWMATRRNANHAFSALAGQGYDADSIQYLTPGFEDITGDGETDADADANLATLETALTDWAVNTEPPATDLLLYLVGPARDGQFLLKSTEGYEVVLSASTLDGWLDAIQSSLTGNLIVIIDAPQSGSFLAPLATPGRIVIAGSSANGRAWFLDDGEISFSWPFWGAVYNGGELFAAFDRAGDVIGQVQTPAIDADGDGLPDPRNRRAPDDPITLGRGRDVETDPPAIGKICPDKTLETGTAYELWAEEVTADNGLSQIWARIFPPVESLQPGDRPVLVLPTLRLQDPDGDERYAETHDDFTQSGAYKVLIHATDKRDHQSIPKPVRVTQTAGLTFDIGDLNVNGIIDLSDVITALKAAAGLSVHDTLHLEPTGDERIGVPDALFLLQKISGKR